MKEPIQSSEMLRQNDLAHVWHPYTQMAEYSPGDRSPIIERGEGVYVYDIEGKRYLDGYSQMWCNVWGHANSEINAAISEQLDRIAHSSLFSASSVPTIELATKLVELCAREFPNTDSGNALSHVFFSDNGSTGVEVALKIALQYQANIGQTQRNRFLCFSDAYHGDTGTTMTLGGVEIFRKTYEALTFEVLRADYPMRSNSFDPPDSTEEATYQSALTNLRTLFEDHGKSLAGVVIEPACQGAGGIRPLFPGYLKALRELCDEHGVLLIADEILVAFGRCGSMFGSSLEDVTPDLLCLSKGLTAGYLPLATTLASSRIYDEFLGTREDFRHLLHGHTFTGNQVGCATALKSLEMVEKHGLIGQIRDQMPFIEERLKALHQTPEVSRIRHCGMMMGIEISTDDSEGYTSHVGQSICAHALELGTIIRPLGNIIVLMPILASSREELAELFDTTEKAIAKGVKTPL